MGLRVESVMMSPDTDQYAGKGQGNRSISDIAKAATYLEGIGFDGVTSPESGHDPYLPLAIAAEHTNKVSLGTNIALAFPRSPMVTAQMAWDLQNYSNGRFALGLGSQVKGHNERRYSTPWTSAPGPRMREYVQCLQAIFTSFQSTEKPTYFKGEHYQFTMLPPFFDPGPIDHPEVPIYLAAVNPYMARLAGELCQGIRLHPIATFSYTEDVIKSSIAEGAAKTGRSTNEIDLLGAPFVAIGRDEEAVNKARNDLRQQISFYASTRSYHGVLRHMDWEDIGLELHALSVDGKWDKMPALITDEMLEEWAVVATYDDFAQKLKQRADGLFSTVLINLPSEALANEEWLKETVAYLQK